MKKILILFISVLIFSSCEERPKPEPKKIYLDSIAYKAGQIHSILKGAFQKGKQDTSESQLGKSFKHKK